MSPDKLIVTIFGGFLILFIYYFFFGKKEKPQPQSLDSSVITVDGGYNPATIYLKKGNKSTLTFLRKDSSSCLEDLYIPDFGIKKYLPLNIPVEINITPKKEGNFTIHCAMRMFKGKIIVTP